MPTKIVGFLVVLRQKYLKFRKSCFAFLVNVKEIKEKVYNLTKGKYRERDLKLKYSMRLERFGI